MWFEFDFSGSYENVPTSYMHQLLLFFSPNLSLCALIDVADMVNCRRLGFDNVSKHVAISSFVVSRERNNMNRMLVKDVLCET